MNIKHEAIFYNDEIIAITQVRVKSIPLINKGIAYIFKGPIWQKKNNINKIEKFVKVLQTLQEEYSKKKNLLLRIRPFIYSDLLIENEFDSLIKYNFIRINQIGSTLILNVTEDLEDIRKNFKQNWRNHLNKSEKNNLIIRRGNNTELVNDFLELYYSMIKRKQLKEGVNIKRFYQLNNQLDENNKVKVIVSYKDEKPISGIIFSHLGNTAISLFRASNEVGMKLNASYLIQYETIKWLKEMGSERYDLGGIDIIKNPHVYDFKSGITKNIVTDFGIIETNDNILSKYLVQSAEYMNKLIKKF
jgi:lipid II:glycine glycyltransferase (peptidoglycan interpeptide bridge formation enzyme)